MGNKIARTTQASATEYYLHDLPSSYNLVLMELVGRGRFLKAVRCKHDEGLLLVKVYFKRAGEPLDLKEYERKLMRIRDAFQNVSQSHVWPFQFWLETDKAAYLLRQYFFSNLHDRLSTRPFLSQIEKKWIAFQLLCAVGQSHSKGVCHGDIKCENVLVTSWNWLYLADFASFKPTYIPDDDPSDFSFFFDTGGRRRCYLAPERFYEHGGEAQVAPDAPLKPSMDIFSLGCVLAELFLEGQPLFELSQLLAYRRGQYDPRQCIEKIQDSGMQKMILHMIQLDPESRMSCESYLQIYASDIFPSYFSPFLHKFLSCMVQLDSDARVEATQSAFQTIREQMMIKRSAAEPVGESATGSELGELSGKKEGGEHMIHSLGSSAKSKARVENGITVSHHQIVGDLNFLLKEVEHRNSHAPMDVAHEGVQSVPSKFSSANSSLSIQPSNHERPRNLSAFMGNKEKEVPHVRNILKSDLTSLVSSYDSQSDTYKFDIFLGTQSKINCEGMVLIASLLCSSIRSVKRPQLRRSGLVLLKMCSLYIDDDDRLQLVVPYVIAMLSDPAAIVRCAALETLCDVLSLVQDFPPSDAMIFPEYILPMLSMLPDDQEESVRICYASNIYKLALTAYRFLVHSFGLADTGSLDKSSAATRSQSVELPAKKHQDNFSSQLAHLRRCIYEIVQELVMGPKQTPNVRRALLQDIGYLCYFFGHRQSNDFLLPILPAFLNDRDEQLRAVFYGQIIFVCYFIGARSVEEYLLPYLEQALSDEMEAVLVNVLECLIMLCKSRDLRKRVLLGLIPKVIPLLCHPIQWVRKSAAAFIVACSESLGPVDTYVYLAPQLRPLLHREPPSLSSEASLLSCLKPPVSKFVLYDALENARNADMLERPRKTGYNSSTYLNEWETVEHSKRVAGDNSLKSAVNKESGVQGGRYSAAAAQSISLATFDEATKGRAPYASRNASVDIKDSVPSDKMLHSGFVSTHVSAGNSSFYDGLSKGIPSYSVCTERHGSGAMSMGSDSSLHWNSQASIRLPWLEPINQTIGLSSSVPPKLPGSFNITASFKQGGGSEQDQEARVNYLSSYITSKFHDVTVGDNMKGSSSSPGDSVSHSEATGLSFTRSSLAPEAGWRPRGILVAHLQEHRSAVNDIAISNDHTFFVTASSDSSIKIWDTRKLEKDISFRSRLTYTLGGSGAMCTTMLRGTSKVVVGASDGILHLFSVDYATRGVGNVVERYSGIVDVKKKEIGEGAILSLINCSPSDSLISQTVLFSTEHCGIHIWDTRANSEAWRFKSLPQEGYISSLVMGQCGNWFISGSSRGVLTLWDLRFLLPVNSWHYSMVCPVEKMCLLMPPPNSLSSTGRPLIYVAAGCNEVSLWNAETGSCHQVFRTAGAENEAEMSNVPKALARPSNMTSVKQDVRQTGNSKYRMEELNEPPPRFPGARSLLPLPGGDLLTGGTDLKIRYWDHARPERSYCVAGPSAKGVGNEETYDVRSSFGVQVVQEMSKQPSTSRLTQKSLLVMAAADSAGCHRDAVLMLASINLNQRLLLSSSRDGAIKVWK